MCWSVSHREALTPPPLSGLTWQAGVPITRCQGHQSLAPDTHTHTHSQWRWCHNISTRSRDSVLVCLCVCVCVVSTIVQYIPHNKVISLTMCRHILHRVCVLLVVWCGENPLVIWLPNMQRPAILGLTPL